MARCTDRRNALLAACGLSLCLAGCSPSIETEAELVSLIRSNCTRVESRVSPKPILRSKLTRIAPPGETTQVDELTQKWTYRLDEGLVDLYVIVETGFNWQQDDPMVFVDFKRLPQQSPIATRNE